VNGQASQGSRFSRWHIEPQREEEQEAWLITYLDMLTLLLVMLVIMLALAGKGDGEQNDPAGSAMLAAGELGVALPEIEIFAYGHLPLAYSARCFTARAENRPKDDCQFCCQNYPEGIPLLSQEGEALFTINGIQTMSASVSNLLADYQGLVDRGAALLRLSPRAAGMEEVIGAFDAVRKGALPPLAVDGCNGYWHGQPGMLRAEEAGLC